MFFIINTEYKKPKNFLLSIFKELYESNNM